MPTFRRQRFIYAHLVWLLGTILVLTLLETLTYNLVFVCSLIGLLIVAELTAPLSVTPRWRRRVNWFITLGVIGFAALVVRRLLDFLPPSISPV